NLAEPLIGGFRVIGEWERAESNEAQRTTFFEPIEKPACALAIRQAHEVQGILAGRLFPKIVPRSFALLRRFRKEARSGRGIRNNIAPRTTRRYGPHPKHGTQNPPRLPSA